MTMISNIIGSIEKVTTIILMAAITLVLFSNVVFRYFLKDPIFWANEASIFMMAWVTFLGGSLSLKYKSQASITFLVNRFSDRIKKTLNIVTNIVILIALGFLIYISFDWIFSLTGTKSSSMRIPMWIPYLSVPVGLTFSFVHILSHVFEYLRNTSNEHGGGEPL